MLVPTAIALVFFYAPVDEDGLNQKIFYFHVPIALTAYACFGWGAWKGLVHLWKGKPGADLESYVAIHLGVIFGAMTLITGSLWAKFRWGHWWLWSERQLVLFLVLFLFYSAYFMLRYLGRSRAAAREPVRRLRDLRRRPDPDQLPRDPAREPVHPSGRVQPARAADGRLAVLHLLRLPGRDAGVVRGALPVRAAGKRLDARLRELRELLA